MAFPADVDIILPKVPNTPLLQFYSNIINNTTPLDIVFSGLVRGQQYHLRCMIYSTQGDVTQRTSSSVSLENYVVVGTTNSTTIPIMPVAPQPTQCAQFQFTSEPGQVTRNAIVNYCQKLFSEPGWANNGCIVCVDSAMTYNVPGLSLPTNITCQTTVAPKTRLRFLQVSSTASTINPGNVTAYNPTSHSVCPVAHPICATDVSGNKAYNEYFVSMIDGLRTPTLFLQNINILNAPINTTNPALTVTDNIAPDLTKYVVGVTASAKAGSVTWTSSFTSPLACWWQISAGTNTAAPTFDAIKGCTDPSWCGMHKVTTFPQTVMTNPNALKAFSAATSYTIYYACTNDIPFAQKKSNVVAAGTFAIAADPVTTSDVITPVTTSSTFVSISMMSLVFLLALLFN